MKKLLLTVAALCLVSLTYAQGYMFVNSEKIFKAITAYNVAMAQLEALGEQYQKNIDTAYGSIEELYNNYQTQKAYLSESGRAAREENIITSEREVAKYQEDVFGPEGEMMKKRIELIKPIQDRVFSAINAFAQQNGFTLVLDVTSNPGILYYSPVLDKTDELIKILQ